MSIYEVRTYILHNMLLRLNSRPLAPGNARIQNLDEHRTSHLQHRCLAHTAETLLPAKAWSAAVRTKLMRLVALRRG